MDKKSRIKAGLVFGIIMTICYILQDLLTNDHHTIKSIIISVASALIGGCIAGLLFGRTAGWFSDSESIMRDTKIKLEANETILFQEPANHFKGIEAVGGKLYLTNHRLVFKSHKFNLQNHELSIPLSQLIKVNRRRTLGIKNNGLAVTTDENKTEKFVIQQREEWMNELQKKVVV